MKIVQIYPGKIWGGAEQYILDLSHNLTSEGHEVIFVARNAAPIVKRLGNEPFETHYLPMKWPFDHTSVKDIAGIIATADVVHIHDTSFVTPISKAKTTSRSNARIVLTRHIARASRTLPWRRKHFKCLHRMVFVSDLANRLWSGVNPWMPDNLKTTVLNSIPPQKKNAQTTLRDKYDIAPTTPLLVFTGRVRKSKGCECIIRALGRLKDKDFAMIFIGACKPTDYTNRLEALARKEGIADRVHFFGFTPDARALIHETDIALAPSIVREACPLSPMEYMQQGIAVIATDNGAQPEYITDSQTGILVAPDDDLALSQKIAMLIDDCAKRELIGKQAKQYFDRNLSYKTFIEKILDVYSTNET